MAEDLDRLANLLGALAIGITDASVGDVGSDVDLDATACAALVTMLDLAPCSSVQRLSQMCGITHSGAVRMINRLAEAGYVQRAPGPDRRTVTVTLTRRGDLAAQRVRDARQRAIKATLSGLTVRQRKQLSAISEVLIANLTSARLARRHAGKAASGGALCRMCDPSACGRPEGVCPAARSTASDKTSGGPATSASRD